MNSQKGQYPFIEIGVGLFGRVFQARCRAFVDVLVSLAVLISSAHAQTMHVTAEEAAKAGIAAYIYGYPLVTMEMTRRVMTNVATSHGMRGPMGQFANAREYPDASFRDVTAFNADTLYSSAWLDLSQEPYILSLPDQEDRYFLMQILSAWTDVIAVPGTRTTGTKARQFAITGPGWNGTLPAGITEFRSPTNMVWIIGRTYCTGTAMDYDAVHAAQDQYFVIPLSAYGKPNVPSTAEIDSTIDMNTPVRDQVNRLDIASYFNMLSHLMKDNPPSEHDARMVATMKTIGIVAGKDFDIAAFNPAVATVLQAVPVAAQLFILGHCANVGKSVNGWIYTENAGYYGTDYLQRAFIAAVGLGANLPQDAIYPTSQVDGDGNTYDGANKYVVHFPKGQTPPVKGFWSLTMYGADLFFVANAANRYAVTSYFPFQYNEDGSLDLYIQTESPGEDKESNWLPAPEGKFVLMLRLYWPRETAPSIITGSWQPPPVRMIK